MAGLLARGSVHLAAFPVSQWPLAGRSPLTVAGAALALGPYLGHPHHIPNCSPHAWHVGWGTMHDHLARIGPPGQEAFNNRKAISRCDFLGDYFFDPNPGFFRHVAGAGLPDYSVS